MVKGNEEEGGNLCLDLI